jgi:hypothetical protein
MSRVPTEATFLNDVRAHAMTVVRDDGVHRHVTFGKPGTSNMRFHLVTWPGELCFTGDMGTFVFNRLRDMFEFFRGSGHDPRDGDGRTLFINLGYWREKLVAHDRHDGSLEYSPDMFRRAVVDHFRDYCRDRRSVPAGLKEALRDDVLAAADEGEVRAFDAANEFEFADFRFNDFWETNLRTYTYRFVWCCYAIAWAIPQYDAARATERAA